MPQNGINHPGVTALATAMQHNAGLRVLNLNDNTFTKRGAIAMAQVQRGTGSGPGPRVGSRTPGRVQDQVPEGDHGSGLGPRVGSRTTGRV